MKKILLLIFALLIILFKQTSFAASSNLQNPQIQAFINEMVSQYHFNQADLEALFSQVTIYPMKTSTSTGAKYIPLESRPWYIYQTSFITPTRIMGGVKFWQKYPKTLARAQKTYGVPASMIIAIIGIESSYGQNKGTDSVINILSTYTFTPNRRSDFFRSELTQYLLLCREQKLNPMKLTGSYDGAIGQPQFMPSSYRSYAVDFSHDGQADLVNNEVDVIGSVANYFRKNGWEPHQPIAIRAIVKAVPNATLPTQGFTLDYTVGQLEKQFQIYPSTPLALNTPVSFIALQDAKGWEYWLGLKNFRVITRYNHSINYAMAAFQLSEAIQQTYQGGLKQKAH